MTKSISIDKVATINPFHACNSCFTWKNMENNKPKLGICSVYTKIHLLTSVQMKMPIMTTNSEIIPLSDLEYNSKFKNLSNI